MRDINSETIVKNVRRWDNPEGDWFDIVSDMMDDEMQDLIRKNVAEAARMDSDDDASDVSDDTSEGDIEKDDGWSSIDTGI